MATIKLGNTKVANKLINYAEARAVERDGVACSPEYAKSQFATTRELYGKTTGIQAHHVIQSFKPGEVSPGQANGIGVELAKEIAKGHECIVYTHADKDHIHNHIVINSVNYENGRKFQLHGKKSIDKVREISDKLCKEKELSVVKEPTAKMRYTQAEQGIIERGQISWKDTIRMAIDKEKGNSESYEDFKNNLKKKYSIEVNDKRKYITYKLDGQKRSVRGKTLGMDYEGSTIEHGFKRQNTRTNEEQRYIGRASDIVKGEQRTQSAHEELYQGSHGRGYSKETNTKRRTGKDNKDLKRNPRELDFDFETARKHSKGLRQNLNEEFGQWKDRDEQEQSDNIGKDGRDRNNVELKNERGKNRDTGRSR
jgi:hypothetical protein